VTLLLVFAGVNSRQAFGLRPDAQSRIVGSLTRQVTASLPKGRGDVVMTCDGDVVGAGNVFGVR
jgi:hypothetical protein